MKTLSLLPLLALLAAGCGGSGPLSSSASRTPKMVVKIAWPNREGRALPAGSNSVKINVIQGATTVGTATVAFPATTATFASLPIGATTVSAGAFASADGTGTAMATASSPTTITDGGTASVTLTMASTVHHVSISPNPVNLALLGILSRQTTVTAYDENNAVVFTTPSDWSYSTTNSLLFNVNSTGLAVGLAVGTASITATAFGKSATAPVYITLY